MTITVSGVLARTALSLREKSYLGDPEVFGTLRLASLLASHYSFHDSAPKLYQVEKCGY